MNARSALSALLIGLSASAVLHAGTVSGIAVSTRNGNSSLQYYGTIEGELWRHDIVNDAVTKHTKLYGGPCSRPVISPDGKWIAFVKYTGSSSGKICKIPAGGGTVTELASCHRHSQIDFPDSSWIYFTMGSYFQQSTSGTIKRVNLSGTVENVVTLKNNDGSRPAGVAQLHVANDLRRCAIRTDDTGPAPGGTAVAFDLVSDGGVLKTSRQSDGGYTCATGISSDGQTFMDGNSGHTGFKMRSWSSISTVSGSTFLNTDALGWAPNNNSTRPSSTNHSIFNSSVATNHSDWICIVMGGARNYAWEEQVLINWRDKRCIVVTAGLSGKWDHGDFWVGSPGGPPPPPPPPAATYGDANLDGSVSMADLNTCVDWLLGRAQGPAAGSQAFINSDVNGDNTISMADLNLLVDFLLGRITRFPLG